MSDVKRYQITSGAAKLVVKPTRAFWPCACISSSLTAVPKSASLTILPSLKTKMFLPGE